MHSASEKYFFQSHVIKSLKNFIGFTCNLKLASPSTNNILIMIFSTDTTHDNPLIYLLSVYVDFFLIIYP